MFHEKMIKTKVVLQISAVMNYFICSWTDKSHKTTSLRNIRNDLARIWGYCFKCNVPYCRLLFLHTAELQHKARYVYALIKAQTTTYSSNLLSKQVTHSAIKSTIRLFLNFGPLLEWDTSLGITPVPF